MAEYETSLPINAPPDAVFDFVADPHNMPKYLPTTHHADMQGEGRVHLQGEVKGNAYDADGWIRLDRTEYRMEWGADGERQYRGWMEIEGAGDQSLVTVHLSFTPSPHESARMTEDAGSPDEAIERGLVASLISIRNLVNGEGAKVEPTGV